MPKPKKPKTIKPSKSKKEPPKIYYEDYLDLLTLRKKPVSERYILGIARHLIEWATKNPEALAIRQFYLENGIDNNQIKRWAKRVPEIAAAVGVAKRAISLRREIGGLKKELSENMVLKSLPFYGSSWAEGEDWKKLEEWRNDMRKSADDKKGDTIINVEMPSYLKPKKKTKKKDNDE